MALRYLPLLTPHPLLTPSFLLPPLSPAGVVVAASPLTPSQLKDRPLPLPLPPSQGLFSRRESLAPGPPLKPRRHGDADKPKGKRPCKTKHTGQRERGEKRRETVTTGTMTGSPDHRRHRLAELGTCEGDEEEEEEEEDEVRRL